MTPPTFAYTIVHSPAHTLEGHPENPSRFRDLGRIRQAAFAHRLSEVTARAATPEELALIHPAEYLDALRRAVESGPAYIDYAPTYVTPDSYRAAVEAAGSTLSLLEAVVAGEHHGGFALVRPPGHHATPTRAMGFCLLNNIALAARRAQALGHRRVMIVDFDVHHGNGTQDAFERDPDVLYLSTHQRDIYPGTGALEDTGAGAGRGSVVNIPLPAGVGDRGFEAIAERIIVPLASRFEPSVLLVSAGFDVHWRDPLASLQLTTTGIYRLATSLAGIAQGMCEGRIVFVLEGGYDPQVLASGVLASMAAALGEPPPEDDPGQAPYPEPEISGIIQSVRRLHLP